MAMREPDFDRDGWCLDDGEEYHHAAPETFWIPAESDRNSLQPGDFAKLIFRISVDDADHPVAVERMWVLVRGRVGQQYFGMLDTNPDALAENEVLWSGVEVPFESRHVIAIIPADEASKALALTRPTRAWPRF
jgi:hypothetical protein